MRVRLGETRDPLVMILERLESMESRMENGFTRLEQRMDALEQRMDALEQRVGALEQRVEQGYQELDRGLVSLHTDLNHFRAYTEERFVEIRQDIQWMAEKWTQLDREVYRIKNR